MRVSHSRVVIDILITNRSITIKSNSINKFLVKQNILQSDNHYGVKLKIKIQNECLTITFFRTRFVKNKIIS